MKPCTANVQQCRIQLLLGTSFFSEKGALIFCRTCRCRHWCFRH